MVERWLMREFCLTHILPVRVRLLLCILFLPSLSFAAQAVGAAKPDSGSSDIEAGIALFKSHDAAAAKVRFSAALRVHPDSADALTWRGIVENQLKQYREAEQDFSAALRINPGQLPAHYNLALCLIRLGDYDRAIDELKTVVEAQPGALEPEYNLALLLEQKHELSEAVEHLNMAHTSRPDDLSVIQHLLIDLDALGRKDDAEQLISLLTSSTAIDVQKETAVTLLEAGDYPSASILLESIRKQAAPNHETDMLLARAYIGADEDDKAIALLQSEQNDDSSGESTYLLGLAYQATGALDKAKTAFEAAIKTNPRSAGAEYHLGMLAFADQNQLPAAVTHFRRAASLEPANSAYAIALGRALLDQNRAQDALPVLQRVHVQGRPAGERDLLLGISEVITRGAQSALPALERAVSEDPSLALSYNILGFCYLAQGETPQAAAAYGKASDLNPQSTLFAHSAAVAYDRASDPKNALIYAERAVALSDARGEDHSLLGKLLSKQGRPQDAIPELNQAIAIDPTSVESYYLLARCYMQVGDSEKANAWVAKLKVLEKGQKTPGDIPHSDTSPISSSTLLRGAPASESHPKE